MYSSTKKWKNFIYNQNISNEFGADCTIFTQLQIIGLTYDIWVPYTTANKIVDKAIISLKLFKWGAIFSVIYAYVAYLAQKHTGEKIKVLKTTILNNKFKEYLDEGRAFGLGLLNGNSNYLSAIKKGILTKDDIDLIKSQGGGFGHNHAFAKKDGEYGIFEIYKGTFIKCSLEVLEYGVKQGIYYSPARSLMFTDKLLEKVLFNYKNGIEIENIQDLPEEEIKAIWRASKLRVFKK